MMRLLGAASIVYQYSLHKSTAHDLTAAVNDSPVNALVVLPLEFGPM